MILLVLLLLVCNEVAQVHSHSTDRFGLLKYNPGDPLPQFRSFHVHVLFQKEHYSDSCSGIDQAFALRDKFIKQFNISTEFICTGDFDQGRFCMFPTALSAFGPFPVPQWAAFVPFDRFVDVSLWIMQNRGALDVFIHPNTGFERNDHEDWGIWAGKPWKLDLSAPEFSVQLGKVYNESCRDDDPVFPIIDVVPKELNASKAHIRFANFANLPQDFSFSEKVLAKGMEINSNTWYVDVDPNIAYLSSSNARLPVELDLNSFYTAIVSPNLELLILSDQNDATGSKGKVRFVNLIPNSQIDILKNDEFIFKSVKYMSASENYETVESGQYIFSFQLNKSKANFASFTLFVDEEESFTVFITPSLMKDDPTNGVIILQDYPQDIPAHIAPFYAQK